MAPLTPLLFSFLLLFTSAIAGNIAQGYYHLTYLQGGLLGVSPHGDGRIGRLEAEIPESVPAAFLVEPAPGGAGENYFISTDDKYLCGESGKVVVKEGGHKQSWTFVKAESSGENAYVIYKGDDRSVGWATNSNVPWDIDVCGIPSPYPPYTIVLLERVY